MPALTVVDCIALLSFSFHHHQAHIKSTTSTKERDTHPDSWQISVHSFSEGGYHRINTFISVHICLFIYLFLVSHLIPLLPLVYDVLYLLMVVLVSVFSRSSVSKLFDPAKIN